MKNEKLVLTALCVIVCAWVAKMLINVVFMARYQDVPVLATTFELSMFLGAGLIPLVAVWFLKEKKRMWLYALWVPCILYVSFLAINLSRFRPVAGSLRISARNAKEVFTKTVTLSPVEWRGGEYSVITPTGSKRTERYRTLLGFPDSHPDCFHVLWHTPPLNPTWHFLKIGDWAICDASRTKDNLTILVFFRVRRA